MKLDWIESVTFALMLSCALVNVGQGWQDQPNIIFIMADDMGFSDTAPYGSEIETPNVSELANQGVRYTRFYNTSRCTTTRASLLTGQYSHNVGMGWLPSTNHNFQNGGTMPGYSGWFAGFDPQAPDNVPTLPEILKTAGYDTYMTGKWHLTRTATIDSGPNGTWPFELGFDKFYGTMEGAKDYFLPVDLVDSDTAAVFEDTSMLPNDFFYTNAISERAAAFIRDEVADGDTAPFFLYHAFYAPHFPLQAPMDAEDENGNNLVAKYQAIYSAGWEVMRANRLTRQIAEGLFPSGTTLSDRDDSDAGIPNWNSLTTTQRDDLILRMAIYAAQVELLDQGIGSILDAIRDPNNDGDESDSIEANTLICFFSDNGAVGGDWNGTGNISNWFNSASATNIRYGTGWANVSDTPFRRFKTDTYEGGITSPFIVSGGPVDSMLAGAVDTTTVGHVIDLVPTAMELAGADYPSDANETELEGTSLRSSFSGNGLTSQPRKLFFEHEGNRGVVDGNWKLVAENGGSDYQLFEFSVDRNEDSDLSDIRPDVQRDLRLDWEEWAIRNQVATPEQSNAGSPFLSNSEVGWIGPRLAAGKRLLIHFDFDQPSYFNGSTIIDQTGNGFDSPFVANDGLQHAVNVDDQVPGLGGAIDLSNDIVDVDAQADIALGPSSRTISVWFNSDVTGNRRIFGYGDPSNNFLPGSLMLLTMVDNGTANVMRLRLGATNIDFDPVDPIGLGQWVHAVIVIPDDASSSSDIKMFIDGQESVGAPEPGDVHVDLITGVSFLTLGRRGGAAAGGTQGTGFDFDGRIGDFQFYNGELSAEQVEVLFLNPGQTIADQRMGDFNSDGLVNLLDVSGFVSALADPDGFEAMNPGFDLLTAGDFNGDGSFNLLDVQGFIDLLSG